jgi:arylsulfatase A-like enzyme
MDALDATGLGDNTVVIYYSDYGETFFYRDDGEHKFVCFDEAILVPVILHWPSRLAAGRVVSEPVGLQDVVPTVLDCAGRRYRRRCTAAASCRWRAASAWNGAITLMSRISRTSESGCSAAIAPSTGS